ncbi:RagB/SusD family nutrient uptake outer membrane protein [Mariniphaga sediminis]|uniref:RagB/SusD family nutrient uptake outer membrane protein n=1 Tax=Mariniphaga sediminis TaxID=1628158 RepID=A0A399CVY9_9BACT|nr:RagB/SusD family nutrient uptake outer membrane protein [Mariniphaga sediminis]RIH62772.1 RagB/SusD family nutrient uptake outer membrane protein [Mariniphaga sediminis]
MKSYKKISIFPFLLVYFLIFTGCNNWLDEQPLSAISEASFWTSESDAMLALAGCYRQNNFTINSYNNEHLILTSNTDDSNYKESATGDIYTGYMRPSDWEVVRSIWLRAYKTIFKANYFLENIDRVEMDDVKKAEITAEVRFIRAYEYFYLSLMYGDVPLITKVLTISDANTQSRSLLEDIRDFCIDEFSTASVDLPATRPDDEKGRILKAASLAVKGRLLMIEKRWSEAASTYKEIIDMNAHIIDPRYKALFEESGENSKEIILSTNCMTSLYPNANNQTNYKPQMYGGYQECNPTQRLIDAFLMNDGLSIEESSLYDPEHPFDNRDPRFYANLFLPEYTVWEGKLYLGHPDLTSDGIKTMPGGTGYCFKKFATEFYDGGLHNSGDDIIYIRYAEVLLSYLESKLENGDNVTQELLDQTINKVRGREEVNMPSVTETSPDKLREIIRRERRVEFCFERHIRYMDIRRWGIYLEVMNRQIYGMKLTDDPDNYTDYPVEKVGKYRGHYKAFDKTGTITPGMELLPIPLYEIDINPELRQNTGY